jgi:hypothetical protein
MLLKSASEYAIRKVQENQQELELNGAHQHFSFADDVNLLGKNTNTVMKNKESLLEAGRKVDLEVNMEKSKGRT